MRNSTAVPSKWVCTPVQPSIIAAWIMPPHSKLRERPREKYYSAGKHSLSALPIAAAHEFFPDLTVVHIDAHGDLRDQYEGSKLSHASIERRVIEKGIPLTEIGIRSFSPEEADFMKTQPDVAIVWGHQLARGEAVIPWQRLSQHTYLTIDLDAIDPAEMPAVGTPEPGGLHWYQLLEMLSEIFRRTTVVGMDVVELCPMEGQTRADFLAAKLVYKMIGYRFLTERHEP